MCFHIKVLIWNCISQINILGINWKVLHFLYSYSKQVNQSTTNRKKCHILKQAPLYLVSLPYKEFVKIPLEIPRFIRISSIVALYLNSFLDVELTCWRFRTRNKSIAILHLCVCKADILVGTLLQILQIYEQTTLIYHVMKVAIL